MKKTKKIGNIIYAGALTVILSVDALIFGELYNQKREYEKIFENVDKDRFLKNKQNKACYMPIGKDGVNVLIEDNFTPEQKHEIITAIKDCDYKFDNIKYNIYLDSTKAPTDCIKIIEQDLEEKILGRAQLNFVGYKIVYPLTISIDRDEYKSQFDIQAILKHELLHTLGLADMYDEKYKGETIMYYAMPSVTNLTKSDVEIINALYTSELTGTNFTLKKRIGKPKLYQNHQIKSKEEGMDL